MKKCRSSLSSFVFCRRKFFVSFFSLLLRSENIFKPHHTLQHTQKKLISVMETSSCKAPAMMMMRSISQTTTRGGGGGRARSADFANPARRQNDIDDDDDSTNNTNKRKSVRARSSRRNVGDNANIVYSLGPEKTSKEPTKMLNRQQWPNECTEIICEDGSSVYCFSYGGGKGVGRANAQSSKATAKGGDFVVQSSSSEEDLNARLNAITMSFREQRKRRRVFRHHRRRRKTLRKRW